jgi:hypothetical protein
MAFPGHHGINKPTGQNSDSWFNFACAHCGSGGAGAVLAYHGAEKTKIRWLMCMSGEDGSVLAKDGNVYPGIAFGPRIEALPAEVDEAYKRSAVMSIS